MIQTVIFDMDGVIIDSEPVYFEIERGIFRELGIAVSFQEHSSYVGTSSQNMWTTIVQRHGVKRRPEELVEKQYDLYMNSLRHNSNLHPIDGIQSLVKELYRSGFKCIVASSSSRTVIDLVLQKLDLSDFFTAKVSGAELSHSKPDPEIFLESARLAGSKPAECVVIEDAENGVTAAGAAGMKCIGFLNPNSGLQNLAAADVVIRSFREINASFIARM